VIVFENVTKVFGKRVVLDRLNLEIPEGKITVILGRSGEGKSVTIKHMMGLLQPSSGTVSFAGQNLASIDRGQMRQFRRNFGILFQGAALFDSLSVFENIAFPLREMGGWSEKQIRAKVESLLEELAIEDLVDAMPEQLSTGEKKRVGLARAIAHEPGVILYDEPTIGMDPLVSEMIDRLIVKVSHERKPKLTSVVISHDLKAALDIGEYIVMLYKGKVQLAGTADDFRKTGDAIVRQFFGGRVDGPMEFF